jgi:hypothetical protein
MKYGFRPSGLRSRFRLLTTKRETGLFASISLPTTLRLTDKWIGKTSCLGAARVSIGKLRKWFPPHNRLAALIARLCILTQDLQIEMKGVLTEDTDESSPGARRIYFLRILIRTQTKALDRFSITNVFTHFLCGKIYLCGNQMKIQVPFTQYAQSSSLFTIKEARELYGKDAHSRSILNLLHRLKL